MLLTHLRKVELQRIISAQTDVQPYFEEIRQRVPLVRQEQRVVAQRTHGQPDLLQVIQILQSRHFAQEDAVRNRMRDEERGSQVIRVSRFTAVRTENERI